MSMRFIHTADWQIGMKAAHVGSVGNRVRDERLHAARRVVEAASKHAVDFMLVAGDTFEDNAVDRVLVQKVGDILAEFAGLVFLIPGNHDPLVPGSVWEHSVWSAHDNLALLRDRVPRPVPGGVIYPCPLLEKHSPRDPTNWIDATAATEIVVGLAHGTVEGIAQDEPDYPIPRDAAIRSGLDYLALGHWHSFASYLDASGATRMAYSGTHETTKFGERDSGNVLLVEIDGRGAPPKVTSLLTGGLRWHSLHEEARLAGDIERVRERIEGLDEPRSALVDLRLSGLLHPADEQELTRIEETMASRFLHGRLDRSQLFPSPSDDTWLAKVPPGVLQDVAQKLRQLAERSFVEARPDHATPEVATQALLDLYQYVREGNA